MKRGFIVLVSMLAALATAVDAQQARPTLFVVGDSTVNNSADGQVGLGNVIGDLFDNTKIDVQNRGRGGRSSRTYFTEGIWDKVAADIKPGDFLFLEFGHNDGGPVDSEKFRGSLKGIGEETKEVNNTLTGKTETIHTYGWYMRKFITDAKAKGATVIVFSQIPRNVWKNGKVERVSDNYGGWSKQVAASAGALFIDLNEYVAEIYEKEGPEKVGSTYFTTKDHTHTSDAGARLNAQSIVDLVQKLKGKPLSKYIVKK